MYNFLYILYHEDGLRENYDDGGGDDDGKSQDMELKCYNEIRITAIKLFIKKKQELNKPEERDRTEEEEEENKKELNHNFDYSDAYEFFFQNDENDENEENFKEYNLKLRDLKKEWWDSKKQKTTRRAVGEKTDDRKGSNDDSDEDYEEEESLEGDEKLEDEFVESVLEKFLVGTESTIMDEVNLMLMIKALANRLVTNTDLENFKMFNMNTVQQSLIKYINAS